MALFFFKKTDQPVKNGSEREGLQSEAERRFTQNPEEGYFERLLTVCLRAVFLFFFFLAVLIL